MNSNNMNIQSDMDMSVKTGYFSGHAVAATGFLLVGFFFLGLTLKRVRSLPYGVSFADAHIPEKNASLLIRAGLGIIPLTMFGICFEAPGWDNIEAPATHCSLYLAMMMVGIVALLEGMKRLPQDSVRITLSLVMILQYCIWNEHALMKVLPADFRLHELLAQLCLVAAAIVAYSVKYPKNVIAYVMQPGISIVLGMWLYTGGFYAAYIDIPVGLIGILLVLEILFVTLIIVLGAAFLVPRSYYETTNHLSYVSVSGLDQDTLCSSNDEDDRKPTEV